MAKEEKKGKDITTEKPGKQHKKEKSTKSKNPKKEDTRLEKMDERLNELEQEVELSKDKYLRLYSEFDNFRKRTQKEKLELSKTASEEVITDLLPILDDFERAIQSLEEAKGSDAALEGVRLIYNKLKGILEQKGLQPIESKGEPFDVDYHDAMTNIPAPSEDLKGKVVEEIEKGYMLNGKVIRFAKVVVGV